MESHTSKIAINLILMTEFKLVTTFLKGKRINNRSFFVLSISKSSYYVFFILKWLLYLSCKYQRANTF
jgi:hypothetical protein